MWGHRLERLFVRFHRRGDVGALGAIFDAVAPEVLGVAMHLARDPSEAEDLLQRTFLTAIERAHAFDPAERLVPWLLGILANHAREAARQARRVPDPARLDSGESIDPVDAAARREILAALDTAIDGLGDPARSVLILRYRHGMEPAAIADALAMPPATVRSHLHRGIERLRRPRRVGPQTAVVIALPSLRGLDEIRNSILAWAEVAVGARVASGALGLVMVGGGVVAKKSLLTGLTLVVVLATGLGGWLAFQGRGTRLTEPEEPIDRAGISGTTSPASRSGLSLEGGTRTVPSSTSIEAQTPLGAGDVVVSARWADGSPSAGVGVMLLTAVDNFIWPSQRGYADAAGQLRFQRAPPGRTLVRTDRGAGAYVDVSPNAPVEVELRHATGVAVQGLVVDATGRAVPDAEIWLSADQMRYLASPVTRTDVEGRFSVRDVNGHIWARARGHAPSAARRALGRAGEVEEVRLVLGTVEARLRGRVVNAQGHPVLGAAVQIGSCMQGHTRLEDGTQGDHGTPVVLISGPDGKFEADGLGAGDTLIGVRARGHGGLRRWVSLTSGGEPTRIELQLPARTTLEGTVLDSSGRVVAGACVNHFDHHLFFGSHALCDEQGRYRIEGLPAGWGSIEVEAGAPGRTAVTASLAISESEPTPWNAVLDQGPTLRLRLVDQDDRPLGGIRIVARGGSGRKVADSSGTDAEGRATLLLGTEAAYQLYAFDPQASRAPLPFAVLHAVRAGPGEVVWRVHSDARSSARIRGSLAVPVGGLPPGTSVVAMPKFANSAPNISVDAGTGLFESDLLPPGRYEVWARVPGYGLVGFGDRRLAAREILDLGAVVLRPPGALIVKAVPPAGSKGSLNARLILDGASEWINDFSKDGLQRISGLQPGLYRICLTGYDPRLVGLGTARVVEGQEVEVGIELRPARQVTLRIDGPPGLLPVDGLSIKVNEATSGVLVTELRYERLAEPESAAWCVLPPGSYRCVAAWEGGDTELVLTIPEEARDGDTFAVTLQR